MSLIDVARTVEAKQRRARNRTVLDRMYDTLPPEAQQEMLTIMADPGLSHSAITAALNNHPTIREAGLSVSDKTLGTHRNNGWTPA